MQKIFVSLRRENPTDTRNYDGVGLLKSEYPEMQDHLGEELALTKAYIEYICERFQGKPVWYRTSDASTAFVNKLKKTEEFVEPNPHFGLRGIRRSIVKEEELLSEISLIEQIRKHYTNLHVIFPMVNEPHELFEAMAIAHKAQYSGRFGIMVETPAAVFNLEDFVDMGVSYFVFGLNDLSDCIYGMSRKNRQTISLMYRDNSLHAVRKMLDTVTWHSDVEYVLSGDFKPEVITLLHKYPFDAVAIPYDLLRRTDRYILEVQNAGR